MQRSGEGKPVSEERRVVVVDTGDDLAGAVRRAIGALGGISSILNGRQTAILKPNFVAGRPSRTGATTSLRLVAAVAEAAHAAGAEPMLLELPGTEFDVEATYRLLGLEEFCRRHEIGLVRKVERWLEVRPPGARRLKRFRVPAQLSEACLINLPVLKTHVVSGISLAMKNLMGLLPHEDRRTMHTLGIQQGIVDLNRGLKPDLNIVDGSIGQDGDGPLYGRPANLGLLVAGRDSLAVDLACCQWCGVDPRAIGHLRLALQQLGERWPEVIGEVKLRARALELPRVSPFYRLAYWLLYALDYPFQHLSGDQLCTTLYRSGLVGTRPHFLKGECTRCGDCLAACPVPGAIDEHRFEANMGVCQRCLRCVEVCSQGAIVVRGICGASPSPGTAGRGSRGEEIDERRCAC